MDNSFLGKRHGFVQQSVRNVCAKFKVYSLSRFHTGALPSEIPLTMEIATTNSL